MLTLHSAVQIGQQADEETQNWLDNMMSNTVNVKASSGSGTDLVSSSKTPKPKPGDRAMRKTLIMRTGTSEVCNLPGTLFGKSFHFACYAAACSAPHNTLQLQWNPDIKDCAYRSSFLPLSCLPTSGELRRWKKGWLRSWFTTGSRGEALRLVISQLIYNSLDSWDFNVFSMPEMLIIINDCSRNHLLAVQVGPDFVGELVPQRQEPEVKLRLSIAQLDYDILDSWDFDVFYYMPEQLIAYVALMFMSLGLTSQDVSNLASPAQNITPFACNTASSLLLLAVHEFEKWSKQLYKYLYSACQTGKLVQDK